MHGNPAGRGSGGALWGDTLTDLARLKGCRKFEQSVKRKRTASSYMNVGVVHALWSAQNRRAVEISESRNHPLLAKFTLFLAATARLSKASQIARLSPCIDS